MSLVRIQCTCGKQATYAMDLRHVPRPEQGAFARDACARALAWGGWLALGRQWFCPSCVAHIAPRDARTADQLAKARTVMVALRHMRTFVAPKAVTA